MVLTSELQDQAGPPGLRGPARHNVLSRTTVRIAPIFQPPIRFQL